MKLPILSLALVLFALSASHAAQGPCADGEVRLQASDGSLLDFFGKELAADGDTAVVGAPQEDQLGLQAGAAYVFVHDGFGWVEEAKLTASDGAARDQFGESVGISGDTIVVGAGWADGGVGAAYVFVRSGGTWTEQTRLVAPDPGHEDHFGNSAAISGETILVGARRATGNALGSGAAYAFVRDAGTWTLEQKLWSAQGNPQWFGHALALEGDTAVIGTPLDSEAANFAGSASVFVRSNESWVEEEYLLAPSPAPSEWFGWSVALSGDVAVVGAVEGGRAAVFRRSAGDWTSEAELGPDPPRASFARSVAIRGDTVLVGSADDTDPAGALAGEAYIYAHDGAAWVRGERFQASDVTGLDEFGRAVALTDERALVTSLFTDGTTPDWGGLYAYDLGAPITAQVAFRNAGTNPAAYAASPAILGETLHLTIDATLSGHDQALVIGFDSPVQVLLGGGQTLLCLDLLGGGELINTGFHAGPLAQVDLPVPDVAALAGLALSTQALLAFGSSPFALSNAQDLVLGGCP